jgi:hypothetical protein
LDGTRRNGILQTDGYAAYDQIGGAKLVRAALPLLSAIVTRRFVVVIVCGD